MAVAVRCVCALLALAAIRAAADEGLPSQFILSVTASGDFSIANQMLQFDPTNASIVYNSIAYPHYEDTLWGCYDAARQRYLLLTEELEVNYYDAKSLAQLSSLSISAISIQFPISMHYDGREDALWLLYPDTSQWCRVSNTSAYNCYSFSGSYMEQVDASAYDHLGGVLWAQMPDQQNNKNWLIGFDARTQNAFPRVEMAEICQHMQVAYVRNTTLLLCVQFLSNNLVSVDTTTGTVKPVYQFPFVHDPVEDGSVIWNKANGESSYFVQLQGPFDYFWTQIDVASGKVVTQSQSAIGNNPPLAMPVYVSA